MKGGRLFWKTWLPAPQGCGRTVDREDRRETWVHAAAVSRAGSANPSRSRGRGQGMPRVDYLGKREQGA